MQKPSLHLLTLEEAQPASRRLELDNTHIIAVFVPILEATLAVIPGSTKVDAPRTACDLEEMTPPIDLIIRSTLTQCDVADDMFTGVIQSYPCDCNRRQFNQPRCL